jgi:sulfur carrier protein ThiS
VKVTVKSLAGSRPTAANRRREIDLPEGASVADALVKFGLENPDTHAALLNDDPVPANERAQRLLKAGDVITAFPPIHGG